MLCFRKFHIHVQELCFNSSQHIIKASSMILLLLLKYRFHDLHLQKPQVLSIGRDMSRVAKCSLGKVGLSVSIGSSLVAPSLLRNRTGWSKLTYQLLSSFILYVMHSCNHGCPCYHNFVGIAK